MDIDTDHLLEQCYSVKYTENTCLSNLFRGAMPFPRTLTRSTHRCYAALVSLVTLTILNLAPTGASASFPLLPYDGSRVTSIAATRNGDGFWFSWTHKSWLERFLSTALRSLEVST
jgi:hypothetical protein